MTVSAPRTYQTREEMPERVQSALDHMMKSHAYRELSTVRLFGHGLQFVTDSQWLKFMVWHINEETEHYFAVSRMYEKFCGESVDAWVYQRLESRSVPFVGSWFELAMAQFLYDRGGFWQLQEYSQCAYPPYREVVGRIVEEERGHQGLGEKIVVELCQSGGYEEVKQSLFQRWFRLGLLCFGRPNTAANRHAVEDGLKRHDAGEVMKAYIMDLKPAMRASGLCFPAPAALDLEMPPDIDWSL